ncbi:MAG TPA: GlxA family transcriptional regulator [Dokdonella sp.]|uniref:GlxA family transcriptional regulator n=1 Tax=Dokdonella sp. TaxID=2291710 RepID=UPI002D7F3853|nr:GlxA family transcriptional regulator [Dokdonella sp.]HET9033746.1 GlxA family transcriptional regulator [Dokdonella sp.]
MPTIGLLIYDDVQALDVIGPIDVFAAANTLSRDERKPYQLLVISLGKEPVRCENGLILVPDTSIDSAPPLDTLLIAGGSGGRQLETDPRLLGWIRVRAVETRRIVSICTGLYILAATGLVQGRRVTTHWRYASDLHKRYPGMHMDADQLFVRDGKYYSSGGLTAGIDLALALVEEDLSAHAALAVARELVMYIKRPGNQAQFSAPLDAQTRGEGRMGEMIDWLLEHLHEDLGIDRLAERVAMSPRNFRRVFADAFGTTPADHVERLRLERACTLLVSGPLSIDRIATATGSCACHHRKLPSPKEPISTKYPRWATGHTGRPNTRSVRPFLLRTCSP